MATPEELERIRSMMRAQETTVTDQALTIQQLREDQKELLRRMELLAASANNTSQFGDNILEKMIKRLRDFNGSDFADWRFRTETAIKGVSFSVRELMEFADKATTEIGIEDVKKADEQHNSNLYYLLTQVMKDQEAMNIVRNVDGENGMEAWRRICKRFGPKTKGKRLYLTRACVNPKKCVKLTDTLSAIEKWERDVRRLASDYKEELSDGLKAAILLELAPSEITDFLSHKLGEDDTYESTKGHIVRYVDTRADFGGLKPMDLSLVNPATNEDAHGHEQAAEDFKSDPGYEKFEQYLAAFMKGGGKGWQQPSWSGSSYKGGGGGKGWQGKGSWGQWDKGAGKGGFGGGAGGGFGGKGGNDGGWTVKGGGKGKGVTGDRVCFGCGQKGH